MATTKPQWATPGRQRHLVYLFHKSGGFCVFGDKGCPYGEHHFPLYMETVIEEWKAEDREERHLLWKLEQQQTHDGTYGRYGNQFDPACSQVARDVYYQQQPEYYLLGFGASAESKKRIAVIRVPSTYIRLYVNVAVAFQGASISRNKKRKMARYQSGPPAQVWAEIDRLGGQAVRDFWASRSKQPVS